MDWTESGPLREEAHRALTTSNTGSVLLQNFVNRVVQGITLREHGAQAVLPRKPGQGQAAIINRRTPGSTATSQSEHWLADTSEPNEGQGEYAQASFTYRTMVARGKVTRKLQATGRGYADVLAEEITARADDFADVFEVALFQGDSNAIANQINGLLTLINAVSGQVVANTSSNSGDALSVSKLDEAIDKVKGSGTRSDLVIFASHKGRRILNAALQANQQFNDRIEIDAGFRVRSYDDIPIVTSTGLPDTLSLGSSGGAILTFGSGATSALVIVNTRYVWIEELTPTTVMPLAKRSSQFDEFDMFWDGTVVLANTKGASILAAIA